MTKRIEGFLTKLFGDKLREEARMELDLATIAARAHAMVESSRLSRRDLASRMGHSSPSTVQRLIGEGSAHNATLETLWKLSRACGFGLSLEFKPLGVGAWQELYKSGSEAPQTLDLESLMARFAGLDQSSPREAWQSTDRSEEPPTATPDEASTPYELVA